MAYDEVNESAVYLCTGQPLPSDIAQIVEWMLNEDFSTAYKSESAYVTCIHVSGAYSIQTDYTCRPM